MIRIDSVSAREFRGLRDLTLKIGSENFAICGPNGSGKSGIIDAIQFCFTGEIARLSGMGTTGLSIRSHGPHVDATDRPEDAYVTVQASIASSGRSITISRSIQSPKRYTVTPDDHETRTVVEELQRHPEFALSRRQIVRYVLTPPGDRSAAVQNLLRLDRLEDTRKAFVRLANDCRRATESAQAHENTVAGDLRGVLSIDDLQTDTILAAVNKQRTVLGLPTLCAIDSETSLKQGVSSPSHRATDSNVRKGPALADYRALIDAISEPEPHELSTARDVAHQSLKELYDDPEALHNLRLHEFTRTGRDFIDGPRCPLCDTEWDADALRAHLQQKLDAAADTQAKLAQLEKHIATIDAALAARIASMERALGHAQQLEPRTDTSALAQYKDRLDSHRAALQAFQSEYDRLAESLQACADSWWPLGRNEAKQLYTCKESIERLPEVSAEDAARDFLITAHERFNIYRDARNRVATCRQHQETAEYVRDTYTATQEGVLESIYKRVADDVSRYYRIVNRGDEDDFTVKIESGPAQLNFNVDFYRRGLYPPGALHSEGHQDSMGLCLYLALMRQTLGNEFTFALLDDIVMSIDANHRREVCRLLKTEFPNTQFIVTTHDPIWLRHMRTEGLINASVNFSDWTVDAGPRVWTSQDVWSDIDHALVRDDVRGAAAHLRQYLEYVSTVLADNVQAQVKFNARAHYDLGDLLPPALSRVQKHLRTAESAARSWSDSETETEIRAKKERLEQLIRKSNAEQWAINPAVHYNEWENFTGEEFRHVTDSFRELLAELQCAKCGSFPYVTPAKGNAQDLRCHCNAVKWNLQKKP